MLAARTGHTYPHVPGPGDKGATGHQECHQVQTRTPDPYGRFQTRRSRRGPHRHPARAALPRSPDSTVAFFPSIVGARVMMASVFMVSAVMVNYLPTIEEIKRKTKNLPDWTFNKRNQRPFKFNEGEVRLEAVINLRPHGPASMPFPGHLSMYLCTYVCFPSRLTSAAQQLSWNYIARWA